MLAKPVFKVWTITTPYRHYIAVPYPELPYNLSERPKYKAVFGHMPHWLNRHDIYLDSPSLRASLESYVFPIYEAKSLEWLDSSEMRAKMGLIECGE